METKPLINRTIFRIYQLVPIQFNSFPHNLFANLKKLHAFIGIYVYFIWLILSLRFEYGGQVNHSVFWLAPILRKPWTLFFQYVWFLFPICLLCLICAMYVTRINAVSWQIARQTFYSRLVYLACLRSHVLRAYYNFESKQAISITLFGRRSNNNSYSKIDMRGGWHKFLLEKVLITCSFVAIKTYQTWPAAITTYTPEVFRKIAVLKTIILTGLNYDDNIIAESM